MSTKSQATNMREVAEEASFQLACAKGFADWIASIVSAIKLDRQHNNGHNAEGLIEIAQYLADRTQADIGEACTVIDGAIAAEGESA